jgi:chromosome segregation ATPase
LSDQGSNKLATVIKWALGLLLAAAASPIVFMAVKSLVGVLFALILTWAIVMGVTQVLPALSFILSNWMLKLVKLEARTNPVETLQNQLIHKQKLLDARKQTIINLDGYVRNFRSKVKAHKEKYPDDATDLESQLHSFEGILSTQRRNYDVAKQQTDAFSDQIERARSKWEATMAAHQVTKLTGKFANSVMDKIKQDTALESVELEMNKAFAELDASLEDGQRQFSELPAAKVTVELPAPKVKVKA